MTNYAGIVGAYDAVDLRSRGQRLRPRGATGRVTSAAMQQILDAIEAGATGDELAALPIPEHYRAAVRAPRRGGDVRGHGVGRQGPAQDPARRRRADAGAGARRGVRRGDGVEHQLQHGVDVDLRAAADVRVPRPPRPGERVGRPPRPATTTSSAPTPSGVVLRVGSAVRNWKPGDRVTVHCNHVDDQDPSAHDDSMLAANQRIWGFETNFGGLADLAVVKANQLMPKPAHLTWEEAAVNALCNSTSYRMLVGQHGARMKQGDVVLVWGATGGIGGYAVQYVLNGGGTPGRRRVVARARPSCSTTHGRARPSSTARPRATVLVRRAHPGRGGVAPVRQGDPRARRRGPRHRVRAPRPPDDGRVGVRLPSAAARSSPARRRRATWSSSTTATSG